MAVSWTLTNLYTGCTPWVNILDYSAIVIPVTKVDKHIDIIDDSYQPMNEDDQKTWENCKWDYYVLDLQH